MKVEKLRRRGLCPAAIARELRMAQSTVQHHVVALGHKPKKYFRKR